VYWYIVWAPIMRFEFCVLWMLGRLVGMDVGRVWGGWWWRRVWRVRGGGMGDGKMEGWARAHSPYSLRLEEAPSICTGTHVYSLRMALEVRSFGHQSAPPPLSRNGPTQTVSGQIIDLSSVSGETVLSASVQQECPWDTLAVHA
jgi:hypothetical protein